MVLGPPTPNISNPALPRTAASTRVLGWAHRRQRVLCWAHRLCCALVQFFGGAYFVLYCFSAHAHVGMHHYKHVGMHHSSDPA